jgi:hypothetical protein
MSKHVIIWKYNMIHHLETIHPDAASDLVASFVISDDECNAILRRPQIKRGRQEMEDELFLNDDTEPEDNSEEEIICPPTKCRRLSAAIDSDGDDT